MNQINHLNLSNMVIREDAHQVVWLTLDKQNASTNTLNINILEELLQCIAACAVRNPKALVIQSGKKNGFIAGADINQFKGLEAVELSTQLIELGQRVLHKHLPTPIYRQL